MKERLKDINYIVDTKGLEFIARKVSMYSGDIRRSLFITSHAVGLAKKENKKRAKALETDPSVDLVRV